MTFFILWISTLISLSILDAVWLLGIARAWYNTQLHHLLSPNVTWPPVIAFYLLYALGLVVFVIKPSLSSSLSHTMLMGGFFGLVAYGAYDLTNHATLLRWPALVTIADMSWGALMSALACGVTYTLYRMLA